MSDDKTYWTLIADGARRGSNRPLLADEHGRRLTARQLHDAACATAAAFAERGIGAGTVVSWQLPTSLETVVVMAALARLGAVQNPIIPILREAEVGFITDQLATEFLVVPEFWRGFDHGGLARALSSDRGFDVITVDLATTPGRRRASATPRERRCTHGATRIRERHPMDLLLVGNHGGPQGDSPY